MMVASVRNYGTDRIHPGDGAGPLAHCIDSLFIRHAICFARPPNYLNRLDSNRKQRRNRFYTSSLVRLVYFY